MQSIKSQEKLLQQSEILMKEQLLIWGKTMDGNKHKLDFVCCFCNKGIESSKFNPAEINILINFDKSKDIQYNQSFFCHIECFRDKIHEELKKCFYLQSIFDE